MHVHASDCEVDNGATFEDCRALMMAVLMTPDMANFSGNVHGGVVLRLLDQVAYSCASSYAKSSAVTLSVDRVPIREAIHVGELVTFAASANYTGRASKEIGIRVDTADISTGERRHADSCYFTMVAVGGTGQAAQVPPLIPHSPVEIQRFNPARLRRKAQRRSSTAHGCDQCNQTGKTE